MHGFSSVSALLINAEVDSMGGVIDGGIGIGTKTSPRRAAIEKAQAELRLEYDVREERRRELEFLERGGNPLDFKFGYPASASVQSTSLSDQQADQILISEAKGSFALTASPPGDSVESSGGPGITVACDPNSADNFDGENQLLETGRKSRYSRSNITPEHSSQLDGGRNVKELGDSPIFHPKRGQAYRRRNPSRTSRDVSRSSSTDIASRGGHTSLLAGRHSTNGKAVSSEDRLDLELVGTNAKDCTSSANVTMLEDSPDPSADIGIVGQHTGSIMTHGSLIGTAPEKSDPAGGTDLAVSAGICPPATVEIVENHDIHQQQDESVKRKDEGVLLDGIMSSVGFTSKGLDSEFLCTQTSDSVDANGIIDRHLKLVDSNGVSKGEKVATDETQNVKDDKINGEEDVTVAVESGVCTNDNYEFVAQKPQSNGFLDEDEKEMHRSKSNVQNDANCSSNAEEMEPLPHAEQSANIKEDLGELPNQILRSSSPQKLQAISDSRKIEPTNTTLSGPSLTLELPNSGEKQLQVADKAHEDKILAEARTVEAKRKKMSELSLRSPRTECHKKSHWDFVVEEMAWLANDFAQERLWKITASAQICHRVALAARLRSIENAKLERLRTTARIVANAVMEFWHSAELLLNDDGMSSGLERCKPDALAYGNIDEVGIVKERMEAIDKEPDAEQGVKNPVKKTVPLVQRYAVRFLQYNSSITAIVRARASETADLEADVSMPDMAWQDHYTEQNLFYLVPPGSMGTYRKFIESSLLCSEKKGINQQDEAEVSMYDTAADFGSQEHDYKEDEAESVSYLPGAFEGSRSLKIVQKKRKTLKSHASRPYGFGGDFTYGNCAENRVGAPQSGSPGKRSMVNVGSIPTKRMRTAASRQRTAGRFSMGAAGGTPTPPRNDASSGDTSSFQDDQGMLHGGCMFQQKVSEGESGMEFDKQSIFDPTDIPAKPKKKKKFKHQASTYDQRWTVESVQNEQRDQLKKRLPGHQYESNGSTGLYVHHAKKQKLMKQSYENSFENTIPVSGSITSPAASQMSNMSNPNKLSKPAGSRDQVRKVKLPKVTIRQPGSGGEWTLYEDQALVVLVHDMGPNWELVSDAFNTTLLFKCAFRKPDECKKRHKTLMDGPSGDGADSADDSGSSQPYQSTLPGIPKGSARQLFRQLQGPLEEDTIKSHFEKITLIGSRLTNRKKQNDNQDLKQVAPVHASHVAALSQAIPNNLNGGVLTPLDLCDVSGPSPDVFPLNSAAAALASPSQGVIPPTVSSIGNASLQNSPGMGMSMGNNLSPAHPNGSTRDGRYGAPRTPLPNDEQHRAQQYNNMLADRNIQQSNMSVSGNMRVIPGGGMGRMPGMNRGMPMQRPDFQGIASSSMPNSGNMLGMPSTSNLHPGASPGQGNSKLRPGDTVPLPRPNHSVERRRQMMLPEMPMQATQANSQGLSAFGGLSSPTSIPVQNFPVHHQQQHPVPQHLNPLINPHHPHFRGPTHANSAEQTYRVARQQQRMLHRQHQQQQQLQSHFPASSPSMVHGQTHSHVAMSSPLPNNSQIQSPSSSQLVSSPSLPSSSPLTPTSQQQHNHQMSPHSFVPNSQIGISGAVNQIGKQQQRQPAEAHQHQQFQQSGRHQPLQRQQSQSLQQAKRLKAMGRSNMLMHQNAPVDPSHLNGLNQGIEKGEQQMHVIQGHGLYSGSKILGPPQHSGTSPSRQKQSSSSAPSSAKQLQQMPFHSEDSIQSQVATLPSALGVPTSTQITPPSTMPSHSRQLHGKHQPPVKLVNRGQNAAKRSSQQSHHSRSNQVPKTQCEESQQDQHLVNNSSPLCIKSETLTTCIESSNQIPTASSASTPTVLSTSPRAGVVGSPLNLVPLPADIKGISPVQLPENLPRNSVGHEWQQEQSKLLKQSQQQLEQLPQIQLPQPQQAQRQIRTEENNSIMRPTDSGLG